MTSQALRSNGNAVFRLTYHLVLTTKYRRKVLTHEMLLRMEEILRARLSSRGSALLEFSGEADHVHVLLEATSTECPADLVNVLKTATSRLLRRDFVALRRAYRRPMLWSSSYCLISAGGAPIEVLEAYVRNQDRPS